MSAGVGEAVVFERTRSGKIAKFNFYQLPLIWVEGDEDVIFFGQLLRDVCRLEPANGRDECDFLLSELLEHNWPYGIIIDGDYHICDAGAEPHERVVILLRYAIENYLLERRPIEVFCQDYVASQDELEGFDERFTALLTELDQMLRNLVIIDAVNQRFGTGTKSFPDNSHEFLNSSTLRLDAARIALYEKSAAFAIQGKEQEDFRQRVSAFIDANGLYRLLRGHFVFGVIAQFVRHVLKKQKAGATFDNRVLLVVLSSNTWKNPPTEEHNTLRQRLKTLVERTKAAKEAFVPGVQMDLGEGMGE